MSEKHLIVVADDNHAARYSKVRALTRAGYELIEAESGNECLRLVRERNPRLVVLDVHMPDINGFEVCRQIKSDPATASIVVLQVSATYVRDEDTVRALEGGADASLTEPVDPPVLVATVRALLRARLAEDALRDALNREQAARTAAESANRAKDEFLATLSHELRSPLGAILTWVTLLRSGRVDESRQPHALEVIERNTRLQVKLIDDLLDVSRIISGKMRLEIALVDLAAIVTAALESFRPAAQAKGLHIETRLEPGVPPVTGDAGRLQQVVRNLLSNAIKFSAADGHVTVTFDRVGERARVCVSDTGQGIDASFLPHLFERFRQADASSTRREGGLGLGLAIVRQLVELHGGVVEAQSEGLGRGATFAVYLPLPPVQTHLLRLPSDQLLRAPVAVPQELEGLRVLLVDDDVDARDAIAVALEEWGAVVTAVSTVREALSVLEGGQIDVVVSDIAMPDEDGYALIREVRARQHGSQRLPALALTAYGGLDERQRIVGAGFDAYLAKPIDARELVSEVRRLGRR